MIAALVQTGHITVSDLILLGAVCVGGFAAWRSKRGEFYKAVAEEKREEAEKLREDNEKLRKTRDLTPIITALKDVTNAVERSNQTSDAVLSKVADMNGALRAHATAMEALADRIVLDEAAKGLLAAAAADKPRTPSQRRRTP